MGQSEGRRELNLQAVRRRQLGYRGEQVMKFINAAIIQEGHAPSYNTICDVLGIGDKATVSRIIARLERRGLLERHGPSWSGDRIRLSA